MPKTINTDEYGDFVLWEAEFIVLDEQKRLTTVYDLNAYRQARR